MPWAFQFCASTVWPSYGYHLFLALAMVLIDLALESPLFQPCTARCRVWAFANILWVPAIPSNIIWGQPVVPYACSVPAVSCSASVMTPLKHQFVKPCLASLCTHIPTARLGYVLFHVLFSWPVHISNIGFDLCYNFLFTYLSLPCHTCWSVCLLVPGSKMWFVNVSWVNE